jgi:hypothetical protein
MVFGLMTPEAAAGAPPTMEEIMEMSNYMDELNKAGVLVDGAGLKPMSKSVLVQFDGKSRTVVDGPFAEAKEVIAGYSILECKDLAECIEWVKKGPSPTRGRGQTLIRPFMGPEDFGHLPEEVVREHGDQLGRAK